MTTFIEEIQNTAEDFVDNVGGEDVTYVYSTEAEGADILTRATAGIMSGKIITLASLGVLDEESKVETRSIKAIIQREARSELTGSQRAHAPNLIMTVVNDSVKGISSDEIDTAYDLIELSIRIGDTPQMRRISEIISMDQGMMILRVR